MLGSDVCKVIGEHREIFPFDIDDFDIVDRRSTQEKISAKGPDLIIHCAAYTDVDGAEREQEKAFTINAIGTRNVALVSQGLDIPMLYISTDYIFDGEKNSPYLENDHPNPLNVYGKSKFAGEKYVKNLLRKFYIVRTAWLYGANGDNFIYKILRASNRLEHSSNQQDSANQSELRVVYDQVGNPTYTLDLAKALDLIVESQRYGIYHVTNQGYCSWYQFAGKIFEILKKEVRLKPVDSKFFNQAARRPRFSALENSVWSKTFGRKLRHWEDALKDFLSSNSSSSRKIE